MSGPLLHVEALTARYGDFQALFGIDLAIASGQTVAIIGANGAGKSTFLRALTGVIATKTGSVTFEGQRIDGLGAADIVKRGIAMVPEGRKLFPSLSVEENLLIGRYGRKVAGHWTLDSIYGLFPILKERRHQPATSLSGGQQQMVAIGRALMSNPTLLLCDEISLGLAPIVIRDIYEAMPRIKAEGTAILVVEQDITQAMAVSDAVFCFMEGRVTLSGEPGALGIDAIRDAYFGAHHGEGTTA